MSALTKTFETSARRPYLQKDPVKLVLAFDSSADTPRHRGRQLVQELSKPGIVIYSPDERKAFEDGLARRVKSGASLEEKNTAGDRPLHLAIRLGLKDTVGELIKNNVEIHAANNAKEAPLDVARKCLPLEGSGRKDILRMVEQEIHRQKIAKEVETEKNSRFYSSGRARA